MPYGFPAKNPGGDLNDVQINRAGNFFGSDALQMDINNKLALAGQFDLSGVDTAMVNNRLSDAQEALLTPLVGMTFFSTGRGSERFYNGTDFLYSSLATNKIIRLRTDADVALYLPAPIGAEISVPAGIDLRIEGDIDLGVNTLVPIPPSTVRGISNKSSSLVSSNAAGPLLLNSLTTGFFNVAELTLSNTTLGQNALILDNGNGMLLRGCVFTNTSICRLNVFSAVAIVENGFVDSQLRLSANATNGGIGIRSNTFSQTTTGTSVNFAAGSIVGNVQLDDNDFSNVSGGISVDLIGSVLQGSITGGKFTGLGTDLNGFDQTSDEWIIANVVGLTTSFNQITVEATAPGTTLAATANVWRTLADSGTTITYAAVNGAPQKWSLTDVNLGQVTYNGVRSITENITGFLSFEGNGADLVEFGFSIDGADPIAGNFVEITTAMSQRGSLTTPMFPIALITGRTVELKFRLNNTSSIDFFQAQLIPS